MESVSTLVILAGGLGRRLGGIKKAQIEVGGLPIIERALSRLEGLFDETVIVDNDRRLSYLPDTRVVPDIEPGGGPLVALLSGLQAATRETAIVIAADMPFLNPAVFLRLFKLIKGADVAIPVVGELLEPAHAIYRVATCRTAVARALQRGQSRMTAFHADVRVVRLAEADSLDLDLLKWSLFNVNTPRDLEIAADRAKEEI